MKAKLNFIFKISLDILFITIFARIVYLITYSFDSLRNMKANEIGYVLIFLIVLFAYALFLVGVYHLRKMGRELLRNQYYSLNLIRSLKTAGIRFILSGLILISINIGECIYDILQGFDPLFDFGIIDPIFYMIIGLFFNIQSKILEQAKIYKEDFDLTI